MIASAAPIVVPLCVLVVFAASVAARYALSLVRHARTLADAVRRSNARLEGSVHVVFSELDRARETLDSIEARRRRSDRNRV